MVKEEVIPNRVTLKDSQHFEAIKMDIDLDLNELYDLTHCMETRAKIQAIQEALRRLNFAGSAFRAEAV